MKLFFDDPEFDGQLQRTAGKVGTDQAMLGEVLATAQQIPAGDHDAWYRAWWTTAERVRGIGDVALREGHRVSAREAYLRAAEYCRQSFFFRRSDLDDEVARAAYRAERDTFLAAAGLFEHAFERVEIPFEGTTLVGHLHRPEGTGRPRPTLVSPGGYEAPWASSGTSSGRPPSAGGTTRCSSTVRARGPASGRSGCTCVPTTRPC